MRNLVLVLLGFALTVACVGSEQKKPEREQRDPHRVLTLPKEPPQAVASPSTDRLVFLVSPLSAKGLLVPAGPRGLKELRGRPRRDVHREGCGPSSPAAGDTRRVPAIVSEIFTADGGCRCRW